jgi:replication gene A protein
MNTHLIHNDDATFVRNRLSILPDAFKKKILSDHVSNLSSKTRREANLELIAVTEKVDSTITHRLNRANINADENDLKAFAKIQASWCKQSWNYLKGKPLKDPYTEIVSRIREMGINLPLIRENPTYTDMLSLIRRAITPTWWLRRLRKTQSLDIERMARTLNLVSKTNQIYVSNENLKRYVHQQKEQQSYLENMIAENEDGDTYFLSELKENSISDPYIKKSELMVRCRGFEELAQRRGFIGLFITLTCPSKYHRSYGVSGESNPAWNGLSVTDGQDYLKEVWARIRASLDRQDIRIFGFRVAEPHHDGTPHWHMLFFVAPSQSDAIKDTFLRYCLEEDGTEHGALENRVTFIDIDPKKGSATGYIAKYISKNINGDGLDMGVYGENPTIAAQRVTAWASIWGIRQFQQIGGAGVSVWRELRRMETVADSDSILEQAHTAADNSDWEGYQIAMGGINIPNADRPISIVYWNEVNTDTGEIISNQYGELKAPSVYGLEFNGETFNTRPHLWKISRAYD